MKDKKKNLVLIIADQLRFDFLHKGFTPTIDEFFDSSLEFTSMYCSSPLCVPARASLFTGTFPSRNKSLINPWKGPDKGYGLVKEGLPNLYQIMENANYDCFHTGKQHLYLEEGQPEEDEKSKTHWLSTEKTYRSFLKEKGYPRPGGERYRTVCPKLLSCNKTIATSYSNAKTGCYKGPKGAYFDEYFTSCLKEGIKDRDFDKPLFLSCMYLAPHPPLCIPEPYYSMYKTTDVKVSENVSKWYEKQSPLQLYQITGAVGNGYEKSEWAETWRVYAGLCTLLDDQVKEILDYLKESGSYEDSLIIISSDHGEMLGSHSLFQKMCMYEESVKLPFAIKLPNSTSKGKVDGLCSQLDILPTILDSLGLKIPNTVEGKSLMPLINKTQEEINSEVFIQFDGTDYLGNFSRCIVDKRYKLVLDIFKDEIFIELYDREKDLFETNNLAFDEKYAKEFERLLALLIKHCEETEDIVDIKNYDFKAVKEAYSKIWGSI